MRALVQRVSSARVVVDGEVVGEIGPGLAVLLGITHTDGEKEAAYLADRCLGMRIFEDESGRMNRSLLETGGGILVISQFTLYGDPKSGRRPSFTAAARPEPARKLYDYFLEQLRKSPVAKVAGGRFGANMRCEFVNEGPVTLLVEA